MSSAAEIAAPGAGTGRSAAWLGRLGERVLPVLTVVAAIVAIWYVAAVFLNAQWAEDQARRACDEH